MSKIVSIENHESFEIDGRWELYEGIVIALDTGETVKVGISNDQHCCENFGFLETADDMSQFIGAEFLHIGRVDVNGLSGHEPLQYLDEGGAMFVNVETSVGQLQYAVYNSHNGYYSHGAVIVGTDGKMIAEETI